MCKVVIMFKTFKTYVQQKKFKAFSLHLIIYSYFCVVLGLYGIAINPFGSDHCSD